MKQIDFGNAPQTKRNVYLCDKFNGVDLSTVSAAISPYRSPEAPNMMPDVTGKPVKRAGYEIVTSYSARINGRYTLGEHEVIHSGTNIYIDSVLKYSTAKDEKSVALRSEDKLYIFDGLAVLKCDGTNITKAQNSAYIPTVTISRAPINAQIESGGTSYEPVNLIGKKWTEKFTVGTQMSTATQFQMSFGNLDSTPVTASVLNSNGVWVDKVETTDFSVDRTTGIITFLTAPGVTPLTGEDNVSITCSRDWGDYPDRINKCDRAILYGFNGTTDRIFASCGNNKDYWCQLNDPTYWGDTWYSLLGQDDVSVINYSLVGSYLATHVKNGDNGRSVIVRDGSTDEDGVVTFPIKNILQGEEATAKRSFVYMETEPLFITARGVYALTEKEITGKEYTQNRSFFINKRLCAEATLAQAECAKWKQYYCIALAGHLYLVDTSQKDYTPKEPETSYQYECYYWTNVDARVLWEDSGLLCFGDSEGNICRFRANDGDSLSYNDETEVKTETFTGDGSTTEFTLTNEDALFVVVKVGNTITHVVYDKHNKITFTTAPADDSSIEVKEHYGTAIEAYWTIPDMFGNYFYENKSVRHIAVSLAPYGLTSLLVEVKKEGIWQEAKEITAKARFFSWTALDWGQWTWNSDNTSKTIGIRKKHKKQDKVIFRFCNRKANEAFGLYQIAIEYTENGKYKQ